MEVSTMVNPNYDPDDEIEERVLSVLKQEGRATPFLIREELGDVRKEYVNDRLDNLIRAGWVEKRTRGLYDFVEDPRESSEP